MNEEKAEAVDSGWHLRRLRAVGLPIEVEPLRNLEDVPFEPIVFQRRVLTPVVAAGAIWVFAFVDLTYPWGLSSFWIFLPLGIFLVLLYPWVFPIYYRLVPGRLDVMRLSLLRNRMWIAEEWDLRRCRITARFHKGTVDLEQVDGPQRRLLLGTLVTPHRFVTALFQAAISTSQAPPLPDDALLG